MKKSLLAFVFSLFFINANSQDVLDTVAKEVCSCANEKKETLKGADANKLQMELGMCIISSFSNHEKDLTAKYGNVMETDGAMEKLGRDVGIKMASVCPDVLMSLAETGLDDEEASTAQEFTTLEGQVVELKSEQFLTLVVKDNSGRTHSLLLFNFFEGSNLLTENKLKKNDKVSVDYWEEEFYDAKAKDFRYYKVMQGLKKL
jgi:hypothetical protein